MSLISTGTTRQFLRESSERLDSYDDATLDALAKDLAVEDSYLKKKIDDGRLELRWEGLVKTVSNAVKMEFRDTADRELQLKQQRSLVEERLRESAEDLSVIGS